VSRNRVLAQGVRIALLAPTRSSSRAGGRTGHLTIATVERHLDQQDAVLGTERFRANGRERYPDFAPTIMASSKPVQAHFVPRPQAFVFVVRRTGCGRHPVRPGPAVCGEDIGIAPSGNINPERTFPSRFSRSTAQRPTSAGRAKSRNPIGQIVSAALLLDHSSPPRPGPARSVAAIERVLPIRKAPRTPDLGAAHDGPTSDERIAAECSAPRLGEAGFVEAR